jgi:prepilin-type N-terminal cleavage/methylation domain-containing protein
MRIGSAKIRSQAAFTLVELLITISAIALLTAFALPVLGRSNESAGYARDIENARSLAAVSQSAQAAGLDFVDPSGSVTETIRRLSTGAAVPVGVFAGEWYQVPLGSREVAGAARFLRVERGLLIYAPE